MADQTVAGEKISKEYRDRYANFSKGAHFVFGTQSKYSIECVETNNFGIRRKQSFLEHFSFHFTYEGNAARQGSIEWIH